MVKEQRDELLIKNRDSIDSPNQLNVNEEIRDLKTELKRQKAVYEAQFIEYVRISIIIHIFLEQGSFIIV